MTEAIITQEAGEAKANMEAIYGQADPRAYFRELGRLGYAIPELAKPIFMTLIDRLKAVRPAPIHALDLGCSYGVNAALLKHDRSMAELRAHWADPALARAEPEQVVAADRAWFHSERADPELAVIGLDASHPAVAYAEEAGLIDQGLALNLEEDPLPEAAAETLAPVDLMLSTGCVGYVTDRTFDALMPAVTEGEAPWIANFVLRMFPFGPIAASLERHGYVTEKLEGETFVQREFASGEEQARVIAQIEQLGLDPAGLEAEGALHAEFFLSRPKAQAGLKVAELLAA